MRCCLQPPSTTCLQSQLVAWSRSLFANASLPVGGEAVKVLFKCWPGRGPGRVFVPAKLDAVLVGRARFANDRLSRTNHGIAGGLVHVVGDTLGQHAAAGLSAFSDTRGVRVRWRAWRRRALARFDRLDLRLAN